MAVDLDCSGINYVKMLAPMPGMPCGGTTCRWGDEDHLFASGALVSDKAPERCYARLLRWCESFHLLMQRLHLPQAL